MPPRIFLCSFAFTLGFSPLAVAQNNDCATAPAIAGAGTHGVFTPGGGNSPTGSCGQMGSNVYWSWTPDQTGLWLLETCTFTQFDSVLAVFDGCAGSELACNDNACANSGSRVLAHFDAGTPVIVAVGGASSATGGALLNISFEGGAPASDDCAAATPVSGIGPFTFDNTAATTDGSSVPCSTGTGAQIEGDVWFSWTASFSGSATVTSCDLSGLDTLLAAYEGNACPTGIPLACSDDACGLRSEITFNVQAGQPYLLRVGTYPGTPRGTGQIGVEERGPETGCDVPGGPDVIVASLDGVMNWGKVGPINGYSIGATACNVGDSTMPWEALTNHHPVIASNMFRVQNGRIEQIGMAWIKHGFGSATQDNCCQCQDPGSGQIMGIGCADTYGSALNGQQGEVGPGFGGIGPRSDVEPFSGDFPFPYTTQGMVGDAIYKRLQVTDVDLDPALNSGARYFGEVHYITPDDSVVGNQSNNATFREVIVTGTTPQGGWNIGFIGPNFRTLPGIFAWQAFVDDVRIEEVQVPSDGLIYVGSKASANGDGTWRYEYAVQNLNSHRSAGNFTVPVPPGVTLTNVAFKDIDYHSGEIYDSTDWATSVTASDVEWSTGTFATPNANALRFGTLYNFAFDADAAPADGQVSLGMFRPGMPSAMSAGAAVPGDLCPATPYCAAAPNSAGPGASLTASGSTSVSANDLVLEVSGAPAGAFGLFFYGPEQTQTPLGDGFQCIGAGALGTFRLPPHAATDGTGALSRSLDFTQPPLNAGAGQIQVGASWNFQLFYRDSAAGGTGLNLSDAVSATFCP